MPNGTINSNIDYESLIDVMERGYTHKEAAEVFGCSPTTISKRISELQRKQGVLLQYRSIQSLQLTELQARILEAITPEKIAAAPLKDLVLAFKILKENELTLEGKPNAIKGLIGYLIQLEKEEANCKLVDNSVEVEFKELSVSEESDNSDDYIPNL